jgi:HSP20 family protein
MSNLTRYSNDLRSLQREMDAALQDFFRPGASQSETWAPRAEVRESDDAYAFTLDVPGLVREDIAIDFHDGTLTVSGQRAAEAKQEGERVVRTERTYGAFYRAFGLPQPVAADGIEAKYEDGVLRVHVPKAEESKPRRIAVA